MMVSLASSYCEGPRSHTAVTPNSLGAIGQARSTSNKATSPARSTVQDTGRGRLSRSRLQLLMGLRSRISLLEHLSVFTYDPEVSPVSKQSRDPRSYFNADIWIGTVAGARVRYHLTLPARISDDDKQTVAYTVSKEATDADMVSRMFVMEGKLSAEVNLQTDDDEISVDCIFLAKGKFRIRGTIQNILSDNAEAGEVAEDELIIDAV